MTISTPPPDGSGGPQQQRQQGRSRGRRWIAPAVAAYALLEIWLLILVGRAAGGFTVLLLLVAGLVLGGLAVRNAGRSAWRSLSEAVRAATPPGQDGSAAGAEDSGATGAAGGGTAGKGRAKGGAGALLTGGLLLMVPGLISDVAGLLFLFPPTRSLLTRVGGRALERRVAARPQEQGSLGDLFRQARDAETQMRIHRPDGKVIPGEVVDRGAGEDNENPGSRH
ncbi:MULTISPECIES: FxsA family membrane protein [unclassified Streptomyces]|uniref:FxsA family membrane protein n=1 Tax=unclassified Streptomyces TaxID=2593676 RepID=UPI0037FD0949